MTKTWLAAMGALGLLLGACEGDSTGRGGSPGGFGGFGDEAGDDGDDSDGDDDDDDAADDGGAADDDDDDDDGEPSDDEPQGEPPPELPFDPDQLGEVCARGNGDRVSQALCNGVNLSSLGELREALGFADPFFALTGNSSSLVTSTTSVINPRLIVGDKNVGGDNPALAMGFARGEQFVELMGYDPSAGKLNMYLLMFEQACNDTEEGCDVADLVTPSVEQDWSRWTLYQDVDLVNTTVDCLVCHKPLGPGTPTIPRLQEVANSWTHWFPVPPPPPSGGGWGSSSSGSGTNGIQVQNGNHGTHSSEVLWPIFESMHGGYGSYGSVPIETLSQAQAGPDIETFVRTTLANMQIPEELQAPGNNVGDEEFFCNSVAMELEGASNDAWQSSYQRVLDGQRLPLPSHKVDITSHTLRDDAIQSYLDVLAGADPDTLVDPRTVVAQERWTEMSLIPRPEADAQEILTHMCGRCHNDKMDPTVSRANFSVGMLDGELTVAQKQVIADRIQRDSHDKLLMPPPRYGSLPYWAKDRVLEWLGE